MLPIHYGKNETSFGLIHSAESTRRNHSLILCQPPFEEAVLTHWTLKQIARNAIDYGYDVLRFDLSGTGNSLVDPSQITLSTWINDIETAIELMEKRTGSKSVSIVAVRFTFAIAAQVSLSRDIEQLIGWDPILDGQVWISQLKEKLQNRSTSLIDLHGHTLSKLFISEIENFNTKNIDSVICNAVTTATHEWTTSPQQLGIDTTCNTENWNWVDPIQNLFYANDSVKQICEYLS